MAVRPPRGSKPTVAATEPANVPTMPADLPAAWGTDVTDFSGHDLTEKKELVGVPFLIIGVQNERNDNRGYDVAYVYALDVNGNEFEFADSSTTGVRTQLQAVLVEQGKDPAPGAGYIPLSPRIVCRKGLRVSDFKAVDNETGKTRTASTYYLSATGVPRSTTEPTKDA